MANTFVTTDLVAKEGIDLLVNQLNFVRLINKRYSAEFNGENAVGNSIKVKVPFNPKTRKKSTAFSAQDFKETYRTLTIDRDPSGVDVSFDALERKLDLDDMSEQVLKPNMANLGAEIESDVMEQLIPTCQSFVAVASADFDHNVARQARATLSNNLVPKGDGLFFFINPNDQVDVLKGAEKLFADNSKIAQQYRDSAMGQALGFTWFESNLIPQLVTGTNALRTTNTIKTTAVNGATTLTLAGATANSTILKGELFTITGVKDVDYQTKKTKANEKQFVVLADATADGAGDITISVLPIYDATGLTEQNVAVMPTAGDVVKFVGAESSTYEQSFAFHPSFATCAFAKEMLPTSIEKASRSDMDGISMSYNEDYDLKTKSFDSRFDCYYGQTPLWEQWGVRIIKI